MLKPGFKVPKGNNRKNHVLRIGMHYLIQDDFNNTDTAEKQTKLWNEEHCEPPLSYDMYKEFPDAWAWAQKYHQRNKEEKHRQDHQEANSKYANNNKQSKKEENIKTATKIVDTESIIWFHDVYQTGYMRVQVKNHFEIYRVNRRDRKFKLFVSKLYYDATGGGTLKDDELAEVLRTLEAKATFSDICKNVKLRKSWLITHVDQENFTEEVDRNVIFYDMCTPHWTCIMVDGYRGTWNLLPHHPENMPFFRYQQRPQVNPKLPGEYMQDILDVWLTKMRILDPKAKLLFMVWIIAFFIPGVPHPILIPSGMQGAAKSTLCKQIQKVTDPYAGDPLMLPTEKKEAAQQAHHRAILIYDNIEYEIPKWLSDFLSQLVTGATVSKRELYSDDNDVLYHLMLSVVLNGLQTPNLKPDAKDRTIELPMERIDDEHRKEQAEIDTWFGDNLSDIMGKIFDTLAKSMQIFPDVKLSRLPRMADFMRRGVSIARALAMEGDKSDADRLQKEFIEAYTEVMKQQNIEVIESNSVADAFVRWVSDYLQEGKEPGGSKDYIENGAVVYSTGNLLNILTMKGASMGFDTKDKDWPKKPAQFVKDIKPAAPDIRNAHQIDIKVSRDSKNNSQIEIRNLAHKKDKKDKGNDHAGSGGAGGASAGGEEEVRTKLPTKSGESLETTSATSRPPEYSKTSSEMVVNPGGKTGGVEVSPDQSPGKTAPIEREIVPSGGYGGYGGTFEKLSLFRIEDFSKNPSPSMISDIKQSALALDPEWDNRPGMDDRLLQFNFYDSQGKNWVRNINRDCNGSESALLDMAEQDIRNYKIVLTYFEKGENMGFSKWNKRCLALGKPSPIFMGFRRDSKDACINIANKDGIPIKDIDLGQVYEMPIIENFLHNIYLSHGLEEVARALLGEGKIPGASGEHFAEMPLEQQITYGLKDAELTFRLAGYNNYAVLSMLEKVGQMFIGGRFANLEKMCNTGPTKWWSALFKNKFNAQPSPTAIRRKGEKGELKGGHVEDINEIKEYRWVVIFDFRGQYPSIISKYNICFTTACCSCCEHDPDAKVRTGLPEVDNNGWWFCRKKRGIVPQIIDALMAIRDDFKTKKRDAEKAGNIVLAQEYDVMQNACKLLANSLYGVFGEMYFEFGDLRVANTITGYGRGESHQHGESD